MAWSRPIRAIKHTGQDYSSPACSASESSKPAFISNLRFLCALLSSAKRQPVELRPIKRIFRTITSELAGLLTQCVDALVILRPLDHEMATIEMRERKFFEGSKSIVLRREVDKRKSTMRPVELPRHAKRLKLTKRTRMH